MAAALLGLGGALPARAAEGEWIKLATPRYTVLSQWNEARTRAWAGEYDQFIDAVATLLRIDTTSLPALTVVIFARERDLHDYLPDKPGGGRSTFSRAFFARRDGWAVAALAGDARDDGEARRLLFHEGVHWLTSLEYPHRLPPWLDEGLAQLFSTARVHDGGLTWGAPDPDMLAFLRSATLLPIDRVLTATRSDPLFDSGAHAGAFYAQSWAFAHYLLLGRGPAGPMLDDEQVRRLKQRHPERLLREQFAATPAEMDTRLRNYLRQRRFATATLPLHAANATVELSTPTAAEVELARGRLALTSGQRRLALRHARRALGMDPSSAAGHELLAVHAAWDARTREAAAAHARRAMEQGSRDAEMPLLIADALGDRPDAQRPEVARRRAALYARALELRPSLRPAYERLAWTLVDAQDVDVVHAAWMERGRALFPEASGPLLGQAVVARRRGDDVTAHDLLQRAREAAAGEPGVASHHLKMLASRWLYDDAQRRVAVLLAAEQHREAIAAVNALLPRLGDPALRQEAVNWRASLQIGERLHAADSALRVGRRAEAHAIYRQLDARPDLSGDLRQWLAIALERTN